MLNHILNNNIKEKDRAASCKYCQPITKFLKKIKKSHYLESQTGRIQHNFSGFLCNNSNNLDINYKQNNYIFLIKVNNLFVSQESKGMKAIREKVQSQKGLEEGSKRTACIQVLKR